MFLWFCHIWKEIHLLIIKIYSEHVLKTKDMHLYMYLETKVIEHQIGVELKSRQDMNMYLPVIA